MKFRRDDGSFDTDGVRAHGRHRLPRAGDRRRPSSSYPTEKIGENARAFRQLGLGYANLGALLMTRRRPVRLRRGPQHRRRDHRADDRSRLPQVGRDRRRGRAPTTSTRRTARPTTAVMRMHRDASYKLDADGVKGELVEAAQRSWDEAVELGDEHGYRNAQATVLAPTGTISFLMDCDTTGIEPDFSLVKFKELVGGGQMTIVNRTVPMALETLGYSATEIEQIVAYINDKSTIVGAPALQGRAPAGVRRRGRRAGDLAHGPHQDDGRGAAVPLGRDLEDGQPAADGDASTTSPRPTPRARSTASRRWRSTATARRPRRRCAPTPRTRPRPRQRPQARAAQDAARARVDHAQVLDRRPRGLHHRRQVRGRHRSARSSSPTSARRARRYGDAERVRDVDLDRPPVRGAARDLREEVQLHALRAGGDHQQPGDPVREVDARLHHALGREPLRRGPRRARGPRHPHQGGPGAQGGPAGDVHRRHRGAAPTAATGTATATRTVPRNRTRRPPTSRARRSPRPRR